MVVRVVRHGCICLARGGMGADTVLLGDALEAPALAALMARIPLQVLRIEIVCAMESLPEGWHIAGVSLPRSQQEPEVARRPVTPVGR